MKKIDDTIADIKARLADTSAAPSAKQLRVVTTAGKKFVIPACDKPSLPATWGAKSGSGQNDFRAGGKCQACHAAVADAEHGLQCCNGGHWVCWTCMASGINWKEAMQDAELSKLIDEL